MLLILMWFRPSSIIFMVVQSIPSYLYNQQFCSESLAYKTMSHMRTGENKLIIQVIIILLFQCAFIQKAPSAL